jgi:predicted ester cyclase
MPSYHSKETAILPSQFNRLCRSLHAYAHQGTFLGLLPTGKQIEISGASVFTVREGKVAQVRMYWDSGHLRRQLGALA